MSRARGAEHLAGPSRSARRRTRPNLLLGLVLLFGAVVFGSALVGCQAKASSNTPSAAADSSSATPPGQVALAVPIELREVLATSPCAAAKSSASIVSTNSAGANSNAVGLISTDSAAPALPVATTTAPPTVLHDVDGANCYQVSTPLMVLQQLNSINVSSAPPASQWAITMTMTKADATTFALLTQEHAGQQLAFVVRNTVLSAQLIPHQISNGTVQIVGNFTQQDATRLMRQLTG